MRRVLPMLLTVVAVVGLPRVLAAADDPRPDGPGRAEVMFQRLDANHDGVLTADEVPAGAPERLKEFLGRAIEKSGGKLTLEQLQAAIKEAGGGPRRGAGPMPGRPGPLGPPSQPGPPGPPNQGGPAAGPGGGFGMGSGFGRGGGFGGGGGFGRGGGFGMGPGGPGPGGGLGMGPGGPGPGGGFGMGPGGAGPSGGLGMGPGGPGPGGGFGMGPRGPGWRGGFGMGPGGPGPQGPSAQPVREPARTAQPSPGAPGGGGRGPFALRALFDRLDKDKDGKLSFEEFAEGMKWVHRTLLARAPWMQAGPARGSWLPWGGPGPRGPQMRPGMHGGWWSGGGPGPHGPQMRPGRPGGPWGPWAEVGRRAWQGQQAAFGPWTGVPIRAWDGVKTAWLEGSKRLSWDPERTRADKPTAKAGEVKKPEAPKRTKLPAKAKSPGDKVQQLERRMDAIEAKLDALLSKSREGK